MWFKTVKPVKEALGEQRHAELTQPQKTHQPPPREEEKLAIDTEAGSLEIDVKFKSPKKKLKDEA